MAPSGTRKLTVRILPIDPGLLERFQSAGTRIAWRPATGGAATRPRRRARIAHLNDEEARVESWGRAPGGGLEVEAGPVGALLVLLEIDRRGQLPRLESRESGADPTFPRGAVQAVWGRPGTASAGPTVRDLVELARYALA